MASLGGIGHDTVSLRMGDERHLTIEQRAPPWIR